MKDDVVEYWAINYHIYNFFKKGGRLDEALIKFNEKHIVNYFWDFYKKNG